jgi:two-component system LytT family response regulator
MNPQKIKAIIVDDEERALQLNVNMISTYCPQVEILGVFDSVDKAYEGILLHKPDLVFLDIDMPPHTGFDLLRKLQPVFFEVIFVTAFNHYAIDAIRFSALDYLMKPVKIDELQNAVLKALERITSKFQGATTIQPLDQMKEITKLVINSQRGSQIIAIKDILYFEADNTYTLFHTVHGNILSSKPMSEYEDMFQDKNFFRIHRSYMVNLHQVKSVDKLEGSQIILSNEEILPLAHRRRHDFAERLKLLS